MPRWVDKNDSIASAEVLRLSRPHPATHKQAGPKHYGFASAAAANSEHAQAGGNVLVVQSVEIEGLHGMFLERLENGERTAIIDIELWLAHPHRVKHWPSGSRRAPSFDCVGALQEPLE
ncbi:hypothetical protein D9M69_542000 [compost metagenome]